MWVQDRADAKVYAYNMPAYTNAPQDVTDTAATGSVTLAWIPPLLAYKKVTGYEVWRFEYARLEQTLKSLGSLSNQTTTYTDTTPMANGVNYAYRSMRAIRTVAAKAPPRAP